MKCVLLAALLAAAVPTVVLAREAAMPPLTAAIEAIDNQKYDVALKLLNGLVKDGDTTAMEILGDMNRAGHGVAPNPQEAARLYRMAEKDNIAARGKLAMMLAEGDGVEKNEDEALALLESIDVAEAQHSAGVLHINRGDLKAGIAKMEGAARKGFIGGMFDIVNAYLMANAEAQEAGNTKAADVEAAHAFAWLYAMNEFAAETHVEQLQTMLSQLETQIRENRGDSAAVILSRGRTEGDKIAADVRAANSANPALN